MHVSGTNSEESGRIGEPASNALSSTLRQFGFPLGRLRTGTPPRLDGKSIHWDKLEPQHSDNPPRPFSFVNSTVEHQHNLITCYLTTTTERTHQIVRNNLDLSPKMVDGTKGVGPRYCPSLEAKVLRFPDRLHQVWLEPEGKGHTLDTHEL